MKKEAIRVDQLLQNKTERALADKLWWGNGRTVSMVIVHHRHREKTSLKGDKLCLDMLADLNNCLIITYEGGTLNNLSLISNIDD